MGKYDKGILGAISGKVGTVVGSRWKGIRYLRSLAEPRKGGTQYSTAETASPVCIGSAVSSAHSSFNKSWIQNSGQKTKSLQCCSF